MEHKKKTVVITGASSGFGLAIAEMCAALGYKLVLLARRGDTLKEFANNVEVPVHYGSVDLQDRHAVKDFFNTLPEDFREVDVLVNNAGLALGASDAQECSLDDWDTMVDTNIKGLLYVTRSVLELMKEKNEGTIVNLGSIAAQTSYRGGNVYGATKAFVHHFSKNLRQDLHETNIRVSTVAPGAAVTEFSNVRFKNNQDQVDAVYEGMRPLTAADIAETIMWIIDRPAHVNIDEITLMSVDQTIGGNTMNRQFSEK